MIGMMYWVIISIYSSEMNGSDVLGGRREELKLLCYEAPVLTLRCCSAPWKWPWSICKCILWTEEQPLEKVKMKYNWYAKE